MRFPLIADPDAQVAHLYDAYKEEWKVSTRATAVIGEDGTVLLAYPEVEVSAKGHVPEVFADCAKLFP